jgi:hypothetical protein
VRSTSRWSARQARPIREIDCAAGLCQKRSIIAPLFLTHGSFSFRFLLRGFLERLELVGSFELLLFLSS